MAEVQEVPRRPDPKVRILNPSRGPATVEVECVHGMRRKVEAEPDTLAIFQASRLLVYTCPACAYEAEGFIESGREFTLPGDVGATP